MNFKKKLFRHLALWDGIWSILLSGFAFLASGFVLQIAFTNPADPQGSPGFYDPSYIQAAAYASFIQVCMNTVVWLGIYFNFRGVWRYFFGTKMNEGGFENESKTDFKKLKEWQKIVLALSLYAFLSLEWFLLFRILV